MLWPPLMGVAPCVHVGHVSSKFADTLPCLVYPKSQLVTHRYIDSDLVDLSPTLAWRQDGWIDCYSYYSSRGEHDPVLTLSPSRPGNPVPNTTLAHAAEQEKLTQACLQDPEGK
jgi:hypothetical protein